jgi:hypothetical protein
MHFRISFTVGIFGGCRRGNNSGINDGAFTNIFLPNLGASI